MRGEVSGEGDLIAGQRLAESDSMTKRAFPGGRPFFMFARHGRALTGASPEHAQIVGSV